VNSVLADPLATSAEAVVLSKVNETVPLLTVDVLVTVALRVMF